MPKTISGVLVGLLALTASAGAQNYPTSPVTVVIPFAAGGPTDVLGRVVGARMSEILGQQVVIENVTGAGGQTGSKRVADSAPDGYNFVIGTVGTHAQSSYPRVRPTRS
jgi:tripartite-type tricarboxylate transporter receptor subunit TctC